MNVKINKKVDIEICQDNPDQRIAQDVNLFVNTLCGISGANPMLIDSLESIGHYDN